MLQLRDITHEPDSAERAGYLDEVCDLETAGFTLLARMAATVSNVHATADAYREPDRSWFIANADRPATVMVSPDGTTLVEVSAWFGGEPHIRFRTPFGDDSLVETQRTLSRGPYYAAAAAAWAPARGHAPGGNRTVVLIDGGVSTIWAAHQAQISVWSGRRGPPRALEGVSTYHELAKLTQTHAVAWERHAAVLRVRVSAGSGLLLVLLMGGAWALGLSGAYLFIFCICGVLGLWLGSPFRHALARSLVAWSPPAYVGSAPAGISDSDRADSEIAAWDDDTVRALEAVRSRGVLALQELGDSADRLEKLASWVHEPDLERWADTEDPRGSLALGFARIAWAWRARGSGYADQVAEDGCDRMRSHLFGALEALERVVLLDPASPEPHAALITVGMGLGEPERSTAAFEAAIARDPEHRGAWSRMLQVLCAKWHGSDEQMWAHARSAPPGLEELIPYAHWEVSMRIDGEAPFDAYYMDPAVADDLRTAWRGFPPGEDDALALNAFAFALMMCEADELARAAFARVGRRMAAEVWDDWATFVAQRQRLGLPAL